MYMYSFIVSSIKNPNQPNIYVYRVLNFKPENTSTKVNGYNFKTLFGNSFVILRLTSEVPR